MSHRSVQIPVTRTQRIHSSLLITYVSHHSCMIIATTVLNGLPRKRYDADLLHLTHAPVTMTIRIAFNCKQQLCHSIADQRQCSTRARRTCMQHIYCSHQHTRRLVAQAQLHAATTRRLHLCMCTAVQRSDACAAAEGKSDLLLLAAHHSAAALVADEMWLAGSECCGQLRMLMLQVRSTRSARVAGVRLVQRSGCSAAAAERAACV
jgi:hypothetical protein